MLQLIISENNKDGIEFFKILNHDKRCIFIKQIEEKDLLALYLAMESLSE